MAKTAPAKKGSAWDSDENEATNNFLKWGEVEDYVLGTLISKKQVPSTLPDKKGELQYIYEIKPSEGLYHTEDGEEVALEAGEIINVGGRAMYNSRMARVKLGQIVGLKFTEELPSKTKGYNPTKLIKVYTPKDASTGEFQMDEAYLEEHKGDEEFN